MLPSDAERLRKSVIRLRQCIEELRRIWKDRVAYEFEIEELEPLLEACETALNALQECATRMEQIRHQLREYRNTLAL